MLIRHAEKPPDSPPPYGVSDDGQPDAQSLTIRGWQRAGALAALFDPAFITSRKHRLLEPRYLYASNSHKHRSKRSRQTLMLLAPSAAADPRASPPRRWSDGAADLE